MLEVKSVFIKPITGAGNLLAAASVDLGDLVLYELKLIRGPTRTFVQFPDWQAKRKCPRSGCGKKNVASAAWCNWCGGKLTPGAAEFMSLVRPKDAAARVVIEEAVLKAYAETKKNAS